MCSRRERVRQATSDEENTSDVGPAMVPNKTVPLDQKGRARPEKASTFQGWFRWSPSGLNNFFAVDLTMSWGGKSQMGYHLGIATIALDRPRLCRRSLRCLEI